MIDREQFVDLIIEPTLQHIGLYSDAATELVLGTALQESRLTYIHQLGNGPALGVFQMEPATHNDIWQNYLKYREDLRNYVIDLASRINIKSGMVDALELISNLNYAAAMCRIHYLRTPDPLPQSGDTAGQAKYWKQYYNTPLGRGTVEEYMRSWLIR